MNKEKKKKRKVSSQYTHASIDLEKREHHGNLTCSAPDSRDMMHILVASLVFLLEYIFYVKEKV